MVFTVYDSGGSPIKIDDSKEISRGGEGRIIQVGKDKVAKLYLPGIPAITPSKFGALFALQNNEFIKPIQLLHNKNNIPIGYMMNMIPSNYFPLFSIYNSNFCDRNLITYKDKIGLFEKIIKSVKYVHDKNIIIGDLNPFNILMNEKCNYFFIDVDSYETPGDKHSGRLLDDIRDYFYNGDITKNSDYFALAVNTFNALTNIHPYKGIHKKYGAISDRMIHRIPVFDNDKDLIVPECYKPIQDKYLQDQFVKIFKNGDRFLIALNKSMAVVFTPTVKTTIKTVNDLIMHEIRIPGTTLNKVIFGNTLLGVQVDDNFHVFNISTKGYCLYKDKIVDIEKYYDELFIHNDKVFKLHQDGFAKKLFYYDFNNKKWIEFIGFEIKDKILYTQQYENILTIVTEEKLFTIYLDQIIAGRIKFEFKTVYGHGFKKGMGLIQTIDGKSYIRHHYGKGLDIIQFPLYLKDVFQIKDVGIAQYINAKNQIKYRLFKIKGLNVELDSIEYDNFHHIGYKENNFILMPTDDKLKIIRLADFAVITEFDCPICTDNSEAYIADAGIILKEGNELTLINKK